MFRLAGSPEEPDVEGNRIELAKVVNKYIDEKLGVVTGTVVSRSDLEGTEEGSIVEATGAISFAFHKDLISETEYIQMKSKLAEVLL